MHFNLDFEGNSEIGAYVRLTNKYIIVGKAHKSNVIDFFREHFTCPVVETTINTIKTVGVLCAGNSKGLILPDTCTDQEMMHIRNSLPPEIKVVRITERLNCLGNVILCNDYACIVSPEIEDENIKIIEETLGVPVYKHLIGKESLVGTFAVLNNQGMLTGPHVTADEQRELSELLGVRVIAGTINCGGGAIGGGIVANDWAHISGSNCTNVEIRVAESVFDLINDGITPSIIAEEIIR